MPALSFRCKFIDALLSNKKQQTTRRSSPRHRPSRVKIGDTGHIYIEQRRAIISKPLREMTVEGHREMKRRIDIGKSNYPPLLRSQPMRYYAHCLGRVCIDDMFDIHPCEMSGEELEAWAWADGFEDVASAAAWFTAQYDDGWMCQWWTVMRWHGWMEQYFIAGTA